MPRRYRDEQGFLRPGPKPKPPKRHAFRDKATGQFRPKRGEVSKGGHRYVPREEKRERGMRVNIYDAARSYQQRRIEMGERRVGLRQILKDEQFRQAWNVWKDRNQPFEVRAEAAELWDWWDFDEDDDRWVYVG